MTLDEIIKRDKASRGSSRGGFRGSRGGRGSDLGRNRERGGGIFKRKSEFQQRGGRAPFRSFRGGRGDYEQRPNVRKSVVNGV